MVTLIFLICDGIEFSTGRSKFSSGKRIKTLSSSNDLSFTLFDRMFPIILLCPIFDEIPIDDIFLLFHKILCPFFANEGFPNLPNGWLEPAQKIIKKHGGIIIADEVQPGFGRLGSSMWSHDMIGIQPDIVTIGKPMAN